MKVFLHIGSHKTATTAIQSVANRETADFRQQGLLYPNYDLIGGSREQSHLRTVDRLLKTPAAEDTQQPERLFAEARRLATLEGLNILLSAESLFRLPADRVPVVAQKLRDAFPGVGFVVVCSLRPRAEFAESMYRNAYRVYRTVPANFVDWMVQSRHLFDYEAILDRYVNALGAERLILPYSRATRPDFVPQFFRSLGVDLPATRVPSKKNPSIGPVDCLAKRLVMDSNCDPEISKRFNNFAGRHPLPDLANYGFLDRTIEGGFLAGFRDSDARLTAMEPGLDEVLGAGVDRLNADPLDAQAQEQAASRAADFARRQTRKAAAAAS